MLDTMKEELTARQHDACTAQGDRFRHPAPEQAEPRKNAA
jgi:hypothetical protein